MKQCIPPSQYLQEIFQREISIPAVEVKDGRWGGITVLEHIDVPLSTAIAATNWIDQAPTEYKSGVRLGLIVANEKASALRQEFAVDLSGMSPEMAKGFKDLLRV